VADWAIGAIRAAPEDQPFFLCVGFRRPHVPCYASQRWFDLYPDDGLEMPPVRDDDRDDTPRYSWYLHWKLPEPRLAWLREAHQWRSLIRSYLASVSFVDSQVGRVLDALDESGRADNTIVVVWSDHGWHLGEKGITGKNSLWERSTRVPLIFAGPGIATDARCDQPVELLDLYPTLVELCGLPANEKNDGHSLDPQLRDAAAERPWPAITTHGPGNHSVRTVDWRYIRYAEGSEELYDSRSDPNEWTNLAGDAEYAEKIRELGRWIPKTSAAPLPGSKSRLVELKRGTAYWEDQRIDPDEPPSQR
jgi:arylsulfatase A-like enzyme